MALWQRFKRRFFAVPGWFRLTRTQHFQSICFGSWYFIRQGDTVTFREGSKVLYRGPVADMPPEIREKLAAMERHMSRLEAELDAVYDRLVRFIHRP